MPPHLDDPGIRASASRALTRADLAAVAGLLVFTVLGAAALSLTPDRPFTPYFGRLPPWVALLVLNLLGAGALYRLQGRFGLRILDPAGSSRAPLKVLLIAPLFAVPAILIDLFVGFPREINVPLPTRNCRVLGTMVFWYHG